MLTGLLLTGGLAGSYAFLPSMAGKARRRLRRRARSDTLYLTFDDGPSRDYTPALLDLLAAYHVPATFFVVGDFARANPDLIGRMQAEGHLVGFHSARHGSAYFMTPAQTKRDFARGLEELAALGVQTHYYRPPWGVVNWSSLAQMKKHRLRPVLWDVMAQDWKKTVTADEIIRRLRRRVRAGDTICLHDGRGAAGAPGRTIEALSVLLPEWAAAGWRFRTVDCDG